MKKIRKISCVFISVLLATLTLSNIPAQAFADGVVGSENYAYEIKDLSVVMDVQEDGKINVLETYLVNFKIESQGLRRDLPEENEFKGTINEKKVDDNFFLPVSNVKSNFPLEIEGENGFKIIKMIDRDVYLDGLNTFELSYTIDTKDLNRLNYSMFYWNLISNTFDTTINQSSFTINFPKSIDANEVYVYSGDFYSEGNNKMDVEVIGNSIYLTSKDILYANQAVTLQVNLDDGYFNYPEIVPNNTALIIGSAVTIVLSLLLIALAGKKEEVVIISTFSAPEGMTSGLVGKTINKTQYLSVPAMYIEWANKGLLAFHEVVDEKKPKKKPKMFVEVLSSDTSSLLPYEKLLFSEYFDKVKEDDTGKRIVSLDKLGKRDVFNAYAAARTSVSKTLKDRGLSLFTTRSIFVGVLLVLNLIHVLAVYSIMTSTYYFLSNFMLAILVGSAVVNLVVTIGLLASRFIQYDKPRLSKTAFGLLSLIDVSITGITSVILLRSHISLIAIILYIASSLIQIVTLYQVLRTSKESALIVGQIYGFKEYISMVEMDSLKVNIEEQPDLFFKVLPYAYIFGLTELWIKKFKTLDNIQPNWYHASSNTTFSYWYWYTFYTSSTRNAVRQSQYLFDPSKSVGSGSSGGMFGGGSGGGGFSGGGFGGGGGGRL